MRGYINTLGRTVIALGYCDRCKCKFPLEELRPDGNTPGLMVCEKDWDEEDPYRRAHREAEDITLSFTRPDTPLSIPQEIPVFLLLLLSGDANPTGEAGILLSGDANPDGYARLECNP